MARSFYTLGLHAPRGRSPRSARQSAAFLTVLLLAALVALWMTSSPATASLLPIAAPT